MHVASCHSTVDGVEKWHNAKKSKLATRLNGHKSHSAKSGRPHKTLTYRYTENLSRMQHRSVYTKEGLRNTESHHFTIKVAHQGASPFTMLVFPVTTVQTAHVFSAFTSLCVCVLSVIGSSMAWSSQGRVPGLCGTFAKGNNTIVLPLLSSDHSHWYAAREGRTLPL